ncbi:MAG TPA: flagellar export chaperone FliS [Bacteroidales bacterium]|nr:flagellar export chaperone FliS [Bacteroidales bacterium]
MYTNTTYTHLKPGIKNNSINNEIAENPQDLVVVRKKNDYVEKTVETATPAKLVEMLYSGAIHFLSQAIKAIAEKHFDVTNDKILRVEDIIMELNVSLDMEKGGEISKNLRALYNYIYKQLLEANIKKDVYLLEECKAYLEDLKETWMEAMKKEGNLAEKLPDPNRNRINIAL